MIYLKIASLITIIIIFIGWIYLLYLFEFKNSTNTLKCRKNWRSTFNSYCHKLYSKDSNIYDKNNKEIKPNYELLIQLKS